MKLREAYQQYQEVKQKGQINLKRQATIGSLENQQYFYRSKNSIFLQHPDTQLQFFQTINNVLETEIKPQKCQYLSKQISKKVRKLEIQQYKNLKDKMIQKFKIRIDELKLKKLKIMSRNCIDDQYYKSRFQLIDLEIISLQNRIQRIKLDEQYTGVLQQPQPTKLYQTQKQQFQHSNIKLDDLQIFLRAYQWECKLKRPFIALLSKINFSYEILNIQTEILSDLALKNSDQNTLYYNNIYNFFEDKLFEITIEKKQKFYDILKTQQFNVFDKSIIQQLGQRYDRLPLIIINKQQCQILFNQSYQLYLNPINEKSKQQKLIYLMNNFCNMIEGFQKYISFWEFPEKTEYHQGGLQKLIIELSTFDDSQEIKEYLKEQYPINSDEIKIKKDDWSELISVDLVKDQYQQYMELQLQTTTIDQQTQKIVLLLNLTETQELKIYISQIIQDIRKNTNLIFNLADNYPYIEFTRKSLRLSQINELFDINQTQTFISCKSKIKQEFLQNLTSIIDDNLPEENMLNAIYNLMVCKIRDYKRKILYYLNAQLSIQRKLAFDLLNIRKAKVPKDIDTQFLIRLREEKLKSQEFEQIDRKSYLSFVKPEPLKLSKFQSQLNKKAKLCKRLPKITYNDDVLPDVQVSISKKIVLYDKAQIYLQKVLERIVQFVSLYINKYEKLTVILKQPQLVDRFQCLLDCFEQECRFQFKKLQLLEKLFRIYEYTSDPQSSYEILETIFQQIEENPLIDVENFYFIDSYTLHIDILQQKINLLERLMAQSEKIENSFIQITFKNYSNYKQKTDPPPKQEEEQTPIKPIDSNYDQYLIGNKMQQIFEELNYKRSSEQIPKLVESRNEIDKNLIMMPHWNYQNCLTFYDSFKNIIKLFKFVEDGRDNMMIQTKSMNSYLSLTLACYKYTFKEINLKPIYDQEPVNEYSLLEDVLKMNIPMQFHTLNNLENIKFEKDVELTELEICQQYLEYVHLKEKHMSILAKTKSAHKKYKQLKGVEKMSKHKELYNSTSSAKKKNIFSYFQYDIDENFEFPEYVALKDSVEEYRLIVMYDKMNLYYLRMNNSILSNNLFDLQQDEQDLKGWQQFRFLREDSKFMKKDQISREFGDKGMLMDIQRNIAIQRQNHQNLKFRKSDFIRIYNSKLKEKNFTPQSNKPIDLAINQKKQHMYFILQNRFKCFLQKQLIYDMLQDCMNIANINQRFQLMKKTQRLINIMPTKVKLKQMHQFDLNKLEIHSVYLEPFNAQAQISEFYQNYTILKSIFFKNYYYPDQLKQQSKNEDLRYLLKLHRYLLILIQNSALQLEQNELMHMSELFLFHMDFNLIDVTQELYFQNSNELVSNPLKALLNYDFLKSENKQQSKNIVVSKAIDEIIEKIKNYHSIRNVFDQHLQQLKIDDVKETTKNLKICSKQIFLNTYNSLVIANNIISREQPNDSFERKLEVIKYYNFQSHRCSFVNLRQFQSKFLCNDKVSWFKINKDKFHSNIIEFINSIPSTSKQKEFSQMCYPYNRRIDQFQGILIFSRITDKERVIIVKQMNESQKIAEYNQMDLYFKLQDFSRQTQIQERIKLKDANIKEILNEYLIDHSIQVMQKEIQMIGSAAEELPQYEDKQKLQKQVVSQVNMPRVKFIQTFQSTQTNIPASLKVSFIQSFLNRLKNKASLVELLSSGLGYVISSLDLEDSLNMLNRELFNFCERELEIRQETFNHLFDLLNHEIKSQSKEIILLKQENEHLKQTFQQRLISLTIAKSNNILFELEGLKQKHKEFKFYTQNLEERIREEIEHDKRLQVDELTFQLDTLQKKFDQFREGLVTICKQEVQNKQKLILQFIQDKTSDILLDQKRSNYQYQEVPSQPNDPYQYVIRINQMRKEHSEQLAAMKQDYDQRLINLEKLERQYKTLKDEVQECKRIENTLKIEVINSQQTINSLNRQKDKLIEENENLLFEKKRLFKHLDDLQQKFKSIDTKTVEIKRRNAISVEHSRTVKASEQIKVTLPKLQIKQQ